MVSISKKRNFKEFVKPTLFTHRFSCKTDLTSYLREQRKSLIRIILTQIQSSSMYHRIRWSIRTSLSKSWVTRRSSFL